MCRGRILSAGVSDGGEHVPAASPLVSMDLCTLNSFSYFNIPEFNNQKSKEINKNHLLHIQFLFFVFFCTIKTVIHVFTSFPTTLEKKKSFHFYQHVSTEIFIQYTVVNIYYLFTPASFRKIALKINSPQSVHKQDKISLVLDFNFHQSCK